MTAPDDGFTSWPVSRSHNIGGGDYGRYVWAGTEAEPGPTLCLICLSDACRHLTRPEETQ